MSSPIAPPTPLPIKPSMSTAMAMSAAYVPANAAYVPANVAYTAMPGTKAPSLQHAIAVPIGLQAPTAREPALPPAESKLPLILVAIACALSGVVVALLVA